jgi:inner membrane protein
MDSLTQIVLGAACGEIALGKKIGNKALLFGAIGGTIKDLDVFIGKLLYTNKIQAMAFHRGFMHSLLRAVLATFVFG